MRGLIGVGVAAVLGAVLLWQPWLGLGAQAGRGLWELEYMAGPFFREGLYPAGLGASGLWMPASVGEGLLLAPLSWIHVTWAWVGLWLLRVFSAAVGTGALLRVRGASPWWALGVALWPGMALWIDAGAIGPGMIMHLPLVLWLLSRRHWGMAGLAGVLIGGQPGIFVALLLWLAIEDHRQFRQRSVQLAVSLGAMWLLLRGWTVLSAQSLMPETREAFFEGGRALGNGSLWGSMVGWGSPLLWVGLGVAGWRDRRLFGVGMVGIFIALGPFLTLSDSVLLVGNKPFPLPLMLLRAFPLLSAAQSLVGFGLMGALAGALALGALPNRARVLLFLLCTPFLGFGARPGHGPVQALPAPESVVYWPPVKPFSADIQNLLSSATWRLQAFQQLLQTHGYTQLRVNGQAEQDQGPEMAWLLGAVASVQSAWPDVELARVNHDSRSTVPPLPAEAGQNAPAQWDGIESGLEGLFSEELGQQALTEVWVYTSTDGQNWLPLRRIAHSLTSLGLSQSPDGALVLTGMVALAGPLGVKFPPFHSSAVVTLTTMDLVHWGARRWWLADRLSLVDSHITWEDGKPALFSWVRTGPLGMDPVALTGGDPFLHATMGEDGRFHADPPSLVVSGFADPSPVAGTDLLYATRLVRGQVPQVVIIRREGEGYRQVGALDQLTVPYVWKVQDHFEMLAHGMRADGQSVVHLRSDDGLTWGAAAVLPGFEKVARCESPVAAYFQSQYVLICSQRIRDARSLEEAPP